MSRAESGDRQLWAQTNHEDRRGSKARPGPYSCQELLDWLKANPDKDDPLLRWFIETQRNPTCGS